jgi:hypothetical protein
MVKLARPIGVMIAAVAAIIPATSAFAAPTAANPKIIYNSLAPPQGNIPSVGFEATQGYEFGNGITLTRSARLASVQVTMSSWGCQSGSWSDDTCTTTPGSTFSEPITLNIYNAPATDPSTQPDVVGSGLPGSLIVSVTKTFAIPFRPSANNSKCIGDEKGDWFDKTNHECFAGFMTNVNFTGLGTMHITLPKNIVFGIAYDTSDYGATPYGDATACHASAAGCGYDSLNIGVSQDPDNIQKGSNPDPGTVYWDTTYAPYYCDGGNAGTGTFRFDSPSTTPCWGVNSPFTSPPWDVPAIQFIATS